MLMRFPNPNCELQCSFSESYRATTCVYYPPMYDKNGNNTNADGNVTTWSVSCGTCGKKWKAKQQYEETTYDEIN